MGIPVDEVEADDAEAGAEDRKSVPKAGRKRLTVCVSSQVRALHHQHGI